MPTLRRLVLNINYFTSYYPTLKFEKVIMNLAIQIVEQYLSEANNVDAASCFLR